MELLPLHSTKPGLKYRDHVLPMQHDPSLGLPSSLQRKVNTYNLEQDKLQKLPDQQSNALTVRLSELLS